MDSYNLYYKLSEEIKKIKYSHCMSMIVMFHFGSIDGMLAINLIKFIVDMQLRRCGYMGMSGR